MAAGDTTTSALADSLPSVISAARLIREFKGVMSQLATKETLGEGIGNDWTEISLSKLNAQVITESTDLDNPQQIVDTPLTITPTMVGIHTFITDRVARRISKNVFTRLGPLAQNAMIRKMDLDGIVQLDGATTSLPGAGNTLTSNTIRAFVARASSNTTEPMPPPYRCVLHGFQIYDIEDEIVNPVGTYEVTTGLTAEVFKNRFHGMVGGAQVYDDDNITIDANADAKGGVFSQYALLLIHGKRPWGATVRKEFKGGGGTSVVLYDEYAWGERAAGSGVYEVMSDATAPA